MTDITILDGGMGKELRRIGAPFRQPEWSALALIEDPPSVVRAHRNFIDAGAQVIITSNYAVVPFHLGDERFDTDAVRLVDIAGRCAREAADAVDRDVLVAGSLPPLFGSYEPDEFDPVRAAPIYRDVVGALAPHVDLWIAETLSTIAEMQTILGAIATIDSALPMWMSFAVPNRFDDGTPALRSGESLTEVADAIAERPVDAVLVNCSLPEQTGPSLHAHRSRLDDHGPGPVRTRRYAQAFPDLSPSGYRANNLIFERREEITPERYADVATGWVRAGATIVGGCCDMYPEHIAALSAHFA
ncbi:MAG: homocysteine S-methyltransferase family protein [Ilumatobacter sp.]